MLRVAAISFLLLLSTPLFSQSAPFRRGDCNNDGGYDLLDAIYFLNYMFTQGAEPGCIDACDCDDSGDLNLIDVIVLLSGLFQGGAIPTPYPECGDDPTADTLDCLNPTCPLPPPPPATLFRINVGGAGVTTGGSFWQSDEYFSGGGTFGASHEIDGTTDDVLYQTERFGNFSYSIPIADGDYDVVLYFAEIFFGAPGAPLGVPGQRVFDVAIEGSTVLPAYDIFAEVGSLMAVPKEFTWVNVSDGFLTIEFTTVANAAKLSAIEIREVDPTNPPPPPPPPPLLSLTNWTRHEIDSVLPYKCVFVTGGDMNGDGLNDIVAGGWWYENPGSNSAPWAEHTVGAPMNNMATVSDFDGDGDLDILGTTGQHIGLDMAWARNDGTGNFTVLTNVDSGTSTYTEKMLQGLVLDTFLPSGPEQVVLSWNGGENGGSQMQALTVPTDPSTQQWTISTFFPTSLGEGIALGDIDGDGDNDIFQGSQWLRNDGGTWTQFMTTTFVDEPDRNRLADIDNDGDLDGVIGFIQGGASIVWLEAPDDPTQPWIPHTINTNLGGGLAVDVADMDNDGDVDVIHGELWGPTRTFVYENEGNGSTWTAHTIDTGMGIDHHDGCRVIDIDGDGDLDVVSIGWFTLKVWLFENLAIP